MSAPTGVTSPPSGTPAGPEPERRPPPRFVRYLLPVAASWLIPVLTHLVHADVLLLPALVLAVAAQLTIGRTLLDRLVPALGLVGGLAIAAGLVFSAWPWGLEPVPVAGSSFTVLSVLAVRTYERTGRRPGLPRRLAGSDLVLLAASGYGAWVAAAPSLRGTPTAGLGYTTLTGDRMRQFTLFDAIHRSGGYPFLNWTSAQSVADPKVGRVYPSGMHYLYALVDVFVRSDTAPGNPVAELDRYRWYVALGFGFLVLAVTWAARWVLGAGRPGWQRALVTAAVGAWTATGVFTTMLWCTWDAEVLGLAFMALAAAVAARPWSRPAEQLLIVGALVAAAGYTYSLYVPFTYALLGVFVYFNRRRLRRHLPFTLVVVPVSLLISALSFLLHLKWDTIGTSDGLLTPGFAIAAPRSTLLILALLSAVGTLSAAGRRRPTTQALAAATVSAAAVVAALGAYQLAKLGYTTYYFQKTMHISLVIGLMTAGTAVTALRPGRPSRSGSVQSRWATGTAGAVAGVIAVGAALPGPLSFRYQDMYPGPDTTWARVWTDGRQIFPVHGAALAYLSNRHLLGDGRPTVVLWDGSGAENRDLTLILAALNHDAGTLGPTVYGLTDIDGLTGIKPPAVPGGPLAPDAERALGALTRVLEASRVPLRVVTPDPVVAGRLRALAASRPTAKLTVLFLPQLPGERSPS